MARSARLVHSMYSVLSVHHSALIHWWIMFDRFLKHLPLSIRLHDLRDKNDGTGKMRGNLQVKIS